MRERSSGANDPSETRPERVVGLSKPDLLLDGQHDLCPGCGEPLAVTAQSAARVVAVLEAASRSAERGGAHEALRV